MELLSLPKQLCCDWGYGGFMGKMAVGKRTMGKRTIGKMAVGE
jgi:hypothetical protein